MIKIILKKSLKNFVNFLKIVITPKNTQLNKIFFNLLEELSKYCGYISDPLDILKIPILKACNIFLNSYQNIVIILEIKWIC